MAHTPVNWDQNRYGGIRYEYKLDSTTGDYSMVEKKHDYTGVTYNFAPLTTTLPITTPGFPSPGIPPAPVVAPKLPKSPLFAEEEGSDVGNKELTGSGYGGAQPPDNTLSGFFKPLEDAMQGKKIGNLGTRIKQRFEDITGKTERDWEEVDTYMEREKEFESNRNLQAKYGTFQEYNKALDAIQGKGKGNIIGSKIVKAPQLLGLGIRTAGLGIKGVLDTIVGVNEADRQRQRHAKQYFSKKGIKTRGQLGSNIDPGRIAGNRATELFAGFNEISAKGDLAKAGAKRITTRNSKKTQDRLTNKYGINSEKVKEFNQITKNMEVQLSNFNDDRKEYDQRTTPGVADQNNDSGSGRDDAGNPGGSSGAMTDDNAGTFCFDPDTCIQMIDGSKKEIKNIQLGDDTKGGEVTGIFQFKPTDEIHDYKGVKVAGSHYVKEDGKFIMVQDSPLSVKIDKIPVVYSLDTTGRRIFINDIEFADYNGDGIAKGFLHNAGLNINGFNKEVLRQVEQRLI